MKHPLRARHLPSARKYVLAIVALFLAALAMPASANHGAAARASDADRRVDDNAGQMIERLSGRDSAEVKKLIAPAAEQCQTSFAPASK